MGIVAVKSIEERRLQEQARLDGLKSAQERNKWGQYATPPGLALSLARYARTLMGKTPVQFLDPALGTGSFFSALSQVYPQNSIATATGIELDPLFSEAAETLWGGEKLQVVQGDFTKQDVSQRFNLVLTNPPYVRHHHLSGVDKDRLKAQIFRSLQLDISGLSGLYCYFMLLSHDWMEERGLAVWLVPSEFMDVNYGGIVRHYLSARVTLLHIHRFCPTDVQFTDALVSSAVVVFRKSAPPADHAVRFSLAGPIERPYAEALVPLDTLRQSRKWTRFPTNTASVDTGEFKLGDLFTIKRGLATGNNKFFLLTETCIDEWQIPRHFVKPILPGPRYLSSDVIEALPSGAPLVSPSLFLLDCNEPEERIEANWPRFFAYLQTGKEQKIDQAYLAGHRSPWYSQEQRPPAPFLCTYMGRSRNGAHPFRFLWNHSQATAHNVYLMLYPKGPLRNALALRPELEARVFEALQSITAAHFATEGRVYGGGLHKVEPRELAQVPARNVLESIGPLAGIARQEKLFA